MRIEPKRTIVERRVLKVTKKGLDCVLIAVCLLSMKSVAVTATGSIIRAYLVIGTINIIQEIKVPKN